MMIENKTALYLSTLIAAALAVGRMTHFSLKKVVLLLGIVFNAEVMLGVLYSYFGFTFVYFVPVLPTMMILIAAVSLIWSGVELRRLAISEREVRRLLLDLSVDASDFSGDLIQSEDYRSSELDEKLDQRIRSIQRFLELIAMDDEM